MVLLWADDTIFNLAISLQSALGGASIISGGLGFLGRQWLSDRNSIRADIKEQRDRDDRRSEVLMGLIREVTAAIMTSTITRDDLDEIKDAILENRRLSQLKVKAGGSP